MRQPSAEGFLGWAAVAGPERQQRAAALGSKPPPVLEDTGHEQSAAQAAVAAERARILREMDKTVSKSLLGISMIAASLASASRSADLQALDQRLRELTWLARRVVSDARSVISDLREEALGEDARSVATAWGMRTGINVSLELAPASHPAEIRHATLAILREALRNVEQHARSSRVRVSLQRIGERLVLIVADDGAGFRLPADSAELQAVGHSGLIAMDGRARQLGGTLTIRSWPGQGTEVEAEIPLPAGPRQQRLAGPVVPPVRVIIADRNPVLRLGLHAMLEHVPGIEIVAEADNGEDAVALVHSHHPDVLLLDVRMPMPGGSVAIPQVRQLTQVVMLTCADDANLVMRAVVAGASGCFMHGEFEQGDLVQVVMDAGRRRPVPARQADLDAASSLPADGGRAKSRPAGLRPREREVMRLIAEGLSNRQIAARLVISEKTVKNHICSIYQCFGVRERSQAVSRWRQLSLT
jgi:DNA-binding NarL/FixJ family response regulator/two-component sensor histidine kinase